MLVAHVFLKTVYCTQMQIWGGGREECPDVLTHPRGDATHDDKFNHAVSQVSYKTLSAFPLRSEKTWICPLVHFNRNCH